MCQILLIFSQMLHIHVILLEVVLLDSTLLVVALLVVKQFVLVVEFTALLVVVVL